MNSYVWLCLFEFPSQSFINETHVQYKLLNCVILPHHYDELLQTSKFLCVILPIWWIIKNFYVEYVDSNSFFREIKTFDH